MNLNEKALLWLDLFEFLTINKKYKLLEFFNNPEDIFSEFNDYESDYIDFKILTKEQFNNLSKKLDAKIVDKYLKQYEELGIKVITYYSNEYPEQFKNYDNPPLTLYLKGDISLLKSRCVAVIGTRKVTRYGERVTEKYVEVLSKNGLTIVSGMASGVDSIAHKTALKNKGKTIAVLGGGIEAIYPKTNIGLSKEIAENGLLVSEYAPWVKAATYHFPVRNRIIVGLCEATLITEAGIKSGVMHSKNYCLDYGKELFVVPGNIDSPYCAGCNEILKSMQGAITTKPQDILESLGIRNQVIKKVQTKQYSDGENLILDILKSDEVHFDELLNKTKLDTKVLLRLLTTMELSGIIKKLAGNFYCRIMED